MTARSLRERVGGVASANSLRAVQLPDLRHERPNNGTNYESILFPAGIVHTGDNVLAVEVHQASAASSDLIFGTRFLAYAGNSEPLQIFQQPASRSVPKRAACNFARTFSAAAT